MIVLLVKCWNLGHRWHTAVTVHSRCAPNRTPLDPQDFVGRLPQSFRFGARTQIPFVINPQKFVKRLVNLSPFVESFGNLSRFMQSAGQAFNGIDPHRLYRNRNYQRSKPSRNVCCSFLLGSHTDSHPEWNKWFSRSDTVGSRSHISNCLDFIQFIYCPLLNDKGSTHLTYNYIDENKRKLLPFFTRWYANCWTPL